MTEDTAYRFFTHVVVPAQRPCKTQDRGLCRDIQGFYCNNGELHGEEHGKRNRAWDCLVVYEG